LRKTKTNNIKLIQLLIKSNKPLFSLSLLALIIGFSFILLFSSISGAIIDTKQNSTINTYGRFLAVVSDINKQEVSNIKSNIPEFDYQEYQILGNLEYLDMNITYGHMDQMLGNYLAFKLIHGTWPSTIEQIVVEEYLVTKMGIDINRP